MPDSSKLNGQQIAAINVAKLRNYFETHRGKLPVHGGKLNKARIAKEAGLDRQIFTNNPAAIVLLSEYGDASVDSRLPSVVTDSQVAEKIHRLEVEVSKFRGLAAKREAELAKRRKEGAEMATRLRVFETMLATMRNPPPPPFFEESST